MPRLPKISASAPVCNHNVVDAREDIKLQILAAKLTEQLKGDFVEKSDLKTFNGQSLLAAPLLNDTNLELTGIASIKKTGVSGIYTTYDITLTDGRHESITISDANIRLRASEAACNTAGDAYFDADTNSIRVLVDTDNKQFVEIALAAGPQGEPGPVGPAGKDGKDVDYTIVNEKIEEAIANARTDLSALVDGISKTIEALNTAVALQKDTVVGHDAAIAALASDLQDINENVNANIQANTNALLDFIKTSNTHASQIESLFDQNKLLGDDSNATKELVQKAQDQLDAVSQEVTDLQTELTTTNNTLTTAQEQIAKNTEDIAVLSSNLTAEVTERTAADAQVLNDAKAHAEEKASTAASSAESNAKNYAKDYVDTEIAAEASRAKEVEDTLKSKIDTNTDELSELSSKHAELETKVNDNATGAARELEEAINSLRAERDQADQEQTTELKAFMNTVAGSTLLEAKEAATAYTNNVKANILTEIDNFKNDTAANFESAAKDLADAKDKFDTDIQTLATKVEEDFSTAYATLRAEADTAYQDLTAALSAETTAREAALSTETEAREAALSTEAKTREDSDNTLRADFTNELDAEKTARINADEALRDLLDSETETRKAADTSLQEALDAEIAAREAANNSANADLSVEIKTREEADINLQTNINTLAADTEAEFNRLIEEYEATNIRHKYEILPMDNLIADYHDDEVRVNATHLDFETLAANQTPSAGSVANQYYIAFRAYAPRSASFFKEWDPGKTKDDTFYDFTGLSGTGAGTDKFGRKYSLIWLSVAYKNDQGTWIPYGANSTIDKYIGHSFIFEWYDEDKNLISTNQVRIALTNDECHTALIPDRIARQLASIRANEASESDRLDNLIASETAARESALAAEITAREEAVAAEAAQRSDLRLAHEARMQAIEESITAAGTSSATTEQANQEAHAEIRAAHATLKSNFESHVSTFEGHVATFTEHTRTAKEELTGAKTDLTAAIEEAKAVAIEVAKKDLTATKEEYNRTITELAKTVDQNAANASNELKTAKTELQNNINALDEELTSFKTDVSKIIHFTTKIVESESEVTEVGILYLILDKNASDEGRLDVYKEYLYINEKPVCIGDTTTDLDNYATIGHVADQIRNLEAATSQSIKETREALDKADKDLASADAELSAALSAESERALAKESELNSAINTLTSTVADNKTELEAAIEAAKSELTAVDAAEKARAEAVEAGLDSRVTELETTKVSELTDAIETLRTDAEKAYATKAEVAAEKLTLNNSIEAAKQEAKAEDANINKAISDFRNAYDLAITGLMAADTTATNSINAANTNINNLATELANFKLATTENLRDLQAADTDLKNTGAELGREITRVESSLTAETNRAAQAETALAVDIAANTAAIEENELAITANSDAITANSKAIKANSDAITAEIADREEAINSAINTEATARTTALNKLTDDLSGEAQRATDAEAALAIDIAVNTATIKENELAIKANSDSIKANSDAITANSEAITAEVADREEAINSEATARNTAINKLTEDLSGETRRATEAETALNTAIEALTTSVAEDIAATEITLKAYADDALTAKDLSLREAFADADTELLADVETKIADVLEASKKYADNNDSALRTEVNRLSEIVDSFFDPESETDEIISTLKEIVAAISANGEGDADLLVTVGALQDAVTTLEAAISATETRITEHIENQATTLTLRVDSLSTQLGITNQRIDTFTDQSEIIADIASNFESKADKVPFTASYVVTSPMGDFVAGESVKDLTIAEILAKLLGIKHVLETVEDVKVMNAEGTLQTVDLETRQLSADDMTDDSDETSFKYTVTNEAGQITSSGYQLNTPYSEADWLTVAIPASIQDFHVEQYDPAYKTWRDVNYTLVPVAPEQQTIDGFVIYTVPAEYKVQSGITIRVVIEENK